MSKNVESFVEWAAREWAKGHALIDPEQAYYETCGEDAPSDLAAAFAEVGVPFRDYARDGIEWQREVESNA